MEGIDPEWVRAFVPKSGLSIADFSIVPLGRDTSRRRFASGATRGCGWKSRYPP